MNVELMTMDPNEAREKLKAYRRALHRRADTEYEAVVAGLEEMDRGRALLDVGRAIVDAPRDEKGRPRLAIARADRQQVELKWTWGNVGIVFDASSQMGRRSETLTREFPRYPYPRGVQYPDRGFALVPMVPAEALEAAGFPDLKRCFVFWEVERWADRRIGARPDPDPYLLRHIGGDMYSVLASWDLTDLERSVMAGRANA